MKLSKDVAPLRWSVSDARQGSQSRSTKRKGRGGTPHGFFRIALALPLLGSLACSGTDEAEGGAGEQAFHMGADITWVQADEFNGATYVDSDGQEKEFLQLMRDHGMNSVRLRSFVDPMAPDGYDQVNGFGGLERTVEMARRVRAAGMGLLISLHYSDNWADPGKQCVPVAWQGSSFDEMVEHLRDYTREVMTTLRDENALPDFIEIGNEITPGMLFSVCDSEGNPMGERPAVNGSNENWDNLGALLRAGSAVVRELAPEVQIVLHIDKGGDLGVSRWWIDNAMAQGVSFDVFANTAYVRWQGQPSDWQNNFAVLAETYPDLRFMIPEYGNEEASSPPTPSTMRIANDLMYELEGNRGVGTWIFEPTHPTDSGIGFGLFETTTDEEGALVDTWPVFTARSEALAVYDEMKVDYAARLGGL